MKSFNLKAAVFAILMMVASISFAKPDEPNQSAQNLQESLNQYVSLIKYGDLTNFNKMFTEDAKFTIANRGKTISHSKNDELSFLRKNKGVTQQCEVVSNVVLSTESSTLVKVSMVYDTFTRDNYVNLIKVGDDWKISSVSSEFK